MAHPVSPHDPTSAEVYASHYAANGGATTGPASGPDYSPPFSAGGQGGRDEYRQSSYSQGAGGGKMGVAQMMQGPLLDNCECPWVRL
jgi:hypothetical protein